MGRLASGLIGIVLLYLGWSYLTPHSPVATPPAAHRDPYAVKKGVDLAMRSLLATLKSIHDLPTAQHAVPILNTIADDLTRYASQMRTLPTIDAQQIKDYIKEFIPHLSAPIEKFRAIDGITAVLEKPLKKIEEALGLYRRH